MPFSPPLFRGQIIKNSELCAIFRCANQGGMRRSRATNTLVLISDRTKPTFQNRWDGAVLHFTGMGSIGHQFLHDRQNRTLAESDTNGVGVFLFVVTSPTDYEYHGQVRLAGPPYADIQTDAIGNPRRVYVFPLRLVEHVRAVPGDR